MSSKTETAASGESTVARWLPIESAPTDRPVVVRQPTDSLQGGWFVATVKLPDPDAEEGRFHGSSTILHYNGTFLMGRFYGTWTHWLCDDPAALASSAGAAAGDWVTVPRDPTPEMIAAVVGMQPWAVGYHARVYLARDDYRAMIEASPALPASPIKGGEGEVLRELSDLAYPGPWSDTDDGIHGSPGHIGEPWNGGDIICDIPSEGDNSRRHWPANRIFIRRLVNAYRAGDLVHRSEVVSLSPGSGADRGEIQGASPDGAGLSPEGEADKSSSSQATSIPRAVHVVMGTTGEYSDRTEWPVCAYLSEAMAEEHVRKASDWLKQNCNRSAAGFKEWEWSQKNKNPFDPGMQLDYTGTDWYVYSVPFAQAIEAHRAETQSGSVEDESAVRTADAHTPSPPSTNPDPGQAPVEKGA